MGYNKFSTFELPMQLEARGVNNFLILDSPPLSGKYREDWNNPVILDMNGMVICHYVTPFKGNNFWTFYKVPMGPETPQRVAQSVQVQMKYLIGHAFFTQYD
ncbi:hypothetical protein [Serratia marcescens]|uniref:hypothetical protein n=1 Tax=Serratia marcescens TaxID=615 RepID=UPI0029E041FD|nr:hypothetical protein [Serratia marcescens]HEM7587222.1 hypothetical protein [Serratia marcescens]